MKEVIILGNGNSRLNQMDWVLKKLKENPDAEIWGCNSAYLEAAKGDLPKLDRLIGDKKTIIEALQCKKKYGLKYKIYGKRPDVGL